MAESLGVALLSIVVSIILITLMWIYIIIPIGSDIVLDKYFERLDDELDSGRLRVPITALPPPVSSPTN